MIIMNDAPLKQPMLNNAGTLDKVWLQYVGDLANVNKGVYGSTTATLSGITSENEIINKVTHQGNLVLVYFKFTGVETVSAEIEIKKYSVYDDVITMKQIDNSGNVTSITNLFVEDNKFTIPDISVTDRVIISGELLRNLGE